MKNSEKIKQHYLQGENTWLVGMLPADAIKMTAEETLYLLSEKFGDDIEDILQPETEIASPAEDLEDALWLRSANTVGINVRTVQNFFNVVKYALTLPAHLDNIHLLPIWEPGVVASLYGIASRNLNTEFFSEELYRALPHLDNTERQLQAVVNVLHALGKTVGMDVIPHTDRYSEIVLANPAYFEWLQRIDNEIVNHTENLHRQAEQEIFSWLREQGSATEGYGLPGSAALFFGPTVSEEMRRQILFGMPDDVLQRGERRGLLLDALYRKGYEPAPATMAPPYRGLRVSDASVRDEFGRVWRDYEIAEPREMSRVFGPLTRFKFYERKEDNAHWEIDFACPRTQVWDYFCEFYAEQARKYRFDFMRGDMSHVQMRPDGVPAVSDVYYDPLKAVKNAVAEEKPWFGYFAESFLTHADYMAYGEEADHLEMSDADSALGNLQSMTPGTAEFLQTFRLYADILQTRYFSPAFTVMTADKDDSRFDEFYVKGNEARLFTSLFLTDMPAYIGLGFECRDVHLSPAPNEYYTKLFVFQINEGPKATRDVYQWGKNTRLFAKLTRIHLFAEKIGEEINGEQTFWLLPPDATGHRKYTAWTQAENPVYIFVVNWNTEKAVDNVKIPAVWNFSGKLQPAFSTETETFDKDSPVTFNGYNYPIGQLLSGEGRAYRLEV